jgi:O-antigen/teichoic acid export membrane protein
MFPVTVGLALVARQAVPLIMGQKWIGMVAPLQVLSVYAGFRAIVALLPKVLTAVGNSRFVMRVEVTGLGVMPLAFWIGSHWGIKGIAFGWVFAYPIVALPHCWKVLKTIDMGVGDYIRALRPALDGSAVMALVIVAFKYGLRSTQPRWFSLLAEIGAGAAVYVITLMLLHRDRVLHFLSIAKGLRRPKVQAHPGIA